MIKSSRKKYIAVVFGFVAFITTCNDGKDCVSPPHENMRSVASVMRVTERAISNISKVSWIDKGERGGYEYLFMDITIRKQIMSEDFDVIVPEKDSILWPEDLSSGTCKRRTISRGSWVIVVQLSIPVPDGGFYICCNEKTGEILGVNYRFPAPDMRLWLYGIE